MPFLGFSQGCSDAGVCTAGDLHGSSGDSTTNKASLNILYSFGIGEQEVLIQAIQPKLTFPLAKNFSLSVSSTFSYISGNLGSTYGFGDVLSTLSLRVVDDVRYKIGLTSGFKMALNSANISKDGRDLPMPYQTSLGTNDILIGANMSTSKWFFSLGYQHPITKNNENTFSHGFWVDSEDAQEYFQSNLFSRGDDLVLRVQRKIKLKNSSLAVGLLPIYRVQEDEISPLGGLDGSQGLTLNTAITWKKKLSSKRELQINGGFPLIFRETRADGLTRVFAVSAAITFLK